MRFGPWHPIEQAADAAPAAPGVLQLRAGGVRDYPTGKSAMLLYAATGADGDLRALVAGAAAPLGRARDAGARWIRFAETPDPLGVQRRLLAHFVERFGAPPLLNDTGDAWLNVPAQD